MELLTKNHLQIKPYLNCNELLVKKFFAVLDSRDYRHILKCDYLPEYDQSLLMPIWDNIIIEYDKLTGKNTFGYQLMEAKHDVNKINRLNGLNAAYQLMLFDQEQGLEDLRYWGVDVKKNSYNEQKRVLSTILMEQTKIKIQEMRKASMPKSKGGTFLDSVTSLENILGRNLDENTITVSKWWSLVTSANAKEKAKKNGSSKRY